MNDIKTAVNGARPIDLLVGPTRRGWASLACGAARRSGVALAQAPLIRDLRLRAEEADWRGGRRPDGFFGRYASVEAAIAAAPSRAIGYDDPQMTDLAAMVGADGAAPPMEVTEYPVMFWLRAAIAAGARRIVDVGGHFGQAYRDSRRLFPVPDDLRWIVFDVPQVAAAGAARARRSGESALAFVTDLAEVEGCDVVLAAGSLQYLSEGFLPRALARFARAPEMVLLQRAALSATQRFVTLQAIRTRSGAVRFCPYTVARRGDLIDDLARLGYHEADAWTVDRVFELPGHPECADTAYHGACLRHVSSG